MLTHNVQTLTRFTVHDLPFFLAKIPAVFGHPFRSHSAIKDRGLTLSGLWICLSCGFWWI